MEDGEQLMASIDSRVVSLKFDNAGFAEKVAQTGRDLQSLNSSIQGLNGASLSNLAKSAQDVKLDNIAEGAKKSLLSIETLATAGGNLISGLASTITSKLWGAIKGFTLDPIMDGFREYESQLNSVQTILGNTASKGETVKTVNAALDELNTYADKTIYNFGEMTANIGKFTAAGVGLKDSVAAIKGISNLAALSGSTSEQAASAMYQLSQALASGTVKLMDWNSVVNAGMGGEEFQKALKRTAMIHGTNVDEMIKTEGSFRDTLQKGWLTSEVMLQTLTAMTGDLSKEQLMAMGYTSEMADEMLVLATNSSDAATKVKTFTQMMGTLKESVGSGWAQTWRLLMGDFEYARTLWTSVTNTIGGLIEANAAARNAKFQEFADIGGATLVWDSFKNILYTVARVIQIVGDTWRKTHEEFSGVDKIATVVQMFKRMTDGMVAWIDNINNMEKLRNILEILITPLIWIQQAFLGLLRIVGAIGRALMPTLKPLVGVFYNLGATIGSIMWTLRKTGSEFDIFGAIAKGVYLAIRALLWPVQKLAEWLNKLTNALFFYVNNNVDSIVAKFHRFADSVRQLKAQVSAKLVEYLQKLGEVLSVLGKYALGKTISGFHILADKLEALWRALAPVRAAFVELRDVLGDRFAPIISAIGAAFQRLGAAVKSNAVTAFSEFVNKVREIYAAIKTGLQPAAEATSTALGNMADGVQATGQKMADMMSGFAKTNPIVQKIANAIHRLTGAIRNIPSEAISGAITAGSFTALKFLSTVESGIRKLFRGLSTIVNKTRESFKYVFSDTDFVPDFSTVGSSLTAVAHWFGELGKSIRDSGIWDFFRDLGGKLAPKIETAFQKILDAVKAVVDYIGNIDITKGLFGLLTGGGILLAGGGIWKFASTIKKFISTIKSPFDGMSKIGDSVVGVIDGVRDSLDAFQTKLKAEALKKIAVAIGILTLSLFAMQYLDLSDTLKGMIPMAIALAGIVTALKQLEDVEINARTVFGIIAVAGAMVLMAKAVKKLEDVDGKQIIVSLGMLTIATKMMADILSKGGKFEGGLTAGISMVLMAMSIKKLADAVAKLGELDTDVLFKGTIATSILIIVVGLFAKLIDKANGLSMRSTTSLLIMAGGMYAFGRVIEKFGAMDFKTALEGITTMGVCLAVAVAALRGIPKRAITKSASLVTLSGGLHVFLKVLREYADFDSKDFKNASIRIGIALAELVLALDLLKKDSIGGAVAITIVVGALWLLLPVVEKLAGMDRGGLVQAGVAIGLLLAGIVAAGYASGPAAIGLVALGAAVVALGGGLWLAGEGLRLGAEAIRIFGENGKQAGEALRAIIDVVIQKLPELATAAGLAVANFILAIAEKTPELVQAGVDFIMALLDGIQQTIPKLFETLGVFFDNLWPFLTEQIPAAVNFGMDLVIALLDGISSRMPELVDKGVDCVVKFLDGLGNNADKILDAAEDFILDLIKAIGDKIVENTAKLLALGWEIAKNIGKGLVDGLDKVSPLPLKKMWNLGGGMMWNLAKRLKINSPSREFRDLAKWIPAGIALGIQDEERQATGAINVMADSMLSTMRGLTDTFGDEVGEPVIKPVLDTSNIENGTVQINRMMNSINPTISSARVAVSGSTPAEINRMVPFNDAHYKSGGSVVFNQYNNSPKALSLWEIHRQTQNQLSAMEAARR